ncbi:MAG: isochorismate synthase [Mediterranea sp.]|jgi:isochorismate synthase|nr:isochorismate synthase [Mediterranea sp.]
MKKRQDDEVKEMIKFFLAKKMLDEYVKIGKPFAIYRHPDGKNIYLVTPDKQDIDYYHDLSKLNGQDGFVFAPFQVTEQCPIVMFHYTQENHCALFGDSPLFTHTDNMAAFMAEHNYLTMLTEAYPTPELDVPVLEEYKKAFAIYMKALQDDRFKKLVLATVFGLAVSEEEGKKSKMSYEDVFYAACHYCPHSFVYMFYTPKTGLWVGATPEVLLSGEEEDWHTMALAGTQPLQNGKLPKKWDEKYRKEQAYVADYIREQLNSIGIQAEEEGPYPVPAGLLSHLRTDFSFKLPESTSVTDLLKLLHPTPAVCGLPKEEAFHFILENEGFDRRYYSGFVGSIELEGTTDLYVNLRCLTTNGDFICLYAGGGLIEGADMEEEWKEAEKKSYTMGRLLRAVPYKDIFDEYYNKEETCTPKKKTYLN